MLLLVQGAARADNEPECAHQRVQPVVCRPLLGYQAQRMQYLEQQKPPASRTLDAQQTPCASTALAGPSQSPHASSTPLAQHSALLSSVAPCEGNALESKSLQQAITTLNPWAGHRRTARAAGGHHACGAAVAGRVEDARAGRRDLAVIPAVARLAHAHARLAHALPHNTSQPVFLSQTLCSDLLPRRHVCNCDTRYTEELHRSLPVHGS